MGFIANLGKKLLGGFGEKIVDYSLGPLLSLFPSHTILGSMGRKMTGSGLSGAEKEANDFTAEREDIAWQRELEASNTQYQRQVADMQAAGLNPAMLYGGSASGASIPSASASGSVSPPSGNLSLLVELENARMQKQLIKAQVRNIDADTKKKVSETTGIDLENDFKGSIAQLRVDAEQSKKALTDSQRDEISEKIKSLRVERGKIRAETKELEERARLDIENAALAKLTAENIAYMQPFIAAEKSASTDLARANAKVAAVDAAYRQGLIDNGMIEAAVRQANASASDSEVRAMANDFQASLRDGRIVDNSKGLNKVGAVLWSALRNTMDLVPLGGSMKN